MAMMDTAGSSDSINASRNNVKRIFNDCFRISAPERNVLAPVSWDELSEDAVCAVELYAHFAEFIANEYHPHDNPDTFLSPQVAVANFRMLVNMASQKYQFTGRAETKLFFQSALGASIKTEASSWFRRLVTQIERTMFLRNYESGSDMLDLAAFPIYPQDVAGMSAALARQGTNAAASQKLIIKSLLLAAGRSGEVAWLSWDQINFDSFYQCAFVQVGQLKTSKCKLVAFCAGPNRHACWFLDVADAWILGCNRSVYVHDAIDGQGLWLFPKLRAVKAPGATIGGYIKALKDVVSTLPINPSAAGIRPGTVNAMASAMPPHFVAAVSGHDFKGLSSLFEYIRALLAVSVPGARVLSGWPAPPWGQCGQAPVPASLAPLEALGVDISELGPLIDKLFQFDSATPPQLLKEGSLRMLVLRVFATVVMYYEERWGTIEMRDVNLQLQKCIGNVYGREHPSGVGGHNMLCQWGAAIKTKFNADNLALMSHSEHDYTAQLTHIGKTLTGLNTAIAQLTHVVESMQEHISHLESGGTVGHCGDSVDGSGSHNDASGDSAIRKDVTGKHAASAAVDSCSGVTQRPSSTVDAFAKMLSVGKSIVKPLTCAGMLCEELMFLYVQNGMPAFSTKQDRTRSEQVKEMFKKMATEDEWSRLLDKGFDEGEKRIMLLHLAKTLKAFITEVAFKDVQKTPPSLRPSSKPLRVSSAETLNKRLKELNLEPINMNDIAAFRIKRGDVAMAANDGGGGGGGGSATKKRRASLKSV